ncbi:hypothetical protein [Citrobacter koseri]|uniref:hypothetical protein n=1 Tax=Citrobacter koseri TaxID=545 RepID=UPI000DF9082D|nr:hypothetical protein [Citrobacter koseri]STB73324.1 Uncharacterised protein [Citrobacter koseri]STT23503.1 Uncharacterised protein [Citrobacter koseri]
MGNLKMKIANTLGSKLKEALASDAKLLKKSVPLLLDAAASSAKDELKKHDSHEYEFKWGTWHKR